MKGSFNTAINPNLKKILSQPYPFDVVDANKKKAVLKFGRDYIIDFGIGDPSDATPEIIRSAVKTAVDSQKSSGYPATGGSKEFKEAICGWMKRRSGVSLLPEEVIATYGAKHACFLLPTLFFEKNGSVSFIPNPGYPPYADGTILANGKPYYLNILEENDFLPDISKIKESDAKKARIFFLNSPHSPTGAVYPKEKLREIVDFCNDNSVILVSDECYNELFFGERPASILEIAGAEECSIVLNSLSKRSMMTGYAIGFLASKNPGLLNPVASFFRKSIQGIANPLQLGAISAWNDEQHTEEMRKMYSQRMQSFIPTLESIGCTVKKPLGTFFIWAKVPAGFTPLSFSEKLLLEYGINSVPGNLISAKFNGINPGNNFARFAMVAGTEKTIEAAQRLKEWK